MPSLFERLLLLPSALLALSVLGVSGDSTTTIIPAPFSFSPDENWDGIDGSWSSFTLRIGTPAQYVRTFVSFSSYQTWAVLPQGCQAAADMSACAETRGWLYNETASSTFDSLGIYDLWVEDHMGYNGNAQYGYDTVGLGGQGEGGPTLQNTTVGGLAVEDFYLGIFGINPKPTNFTSFNEPSTSYMTLLKEQGHIPSVSFGYTAGAHYRFTGVLASLTLGGYDASKFVENNVTFIFGPDNERDVSVAIQSITTPSQIKSSPSATELLPAPIYAYIDATLPQIWLPLEACQAFEYEFGLIYDNTTQLYLVNNTLHQQLLDRDANVTFTLAQGLTGGETVQIVLPYAAFDLQANPPYQGLGNTTNYFPLRRALNESQYVLGRTFLQEAYITVDYEAQRFQLAQTAWDQTAQKSLVAIPPYNMSQPSSDWTSSTWQQPGSSGNSTGGNGYPGASSPSSKSKSISGGAIAGVVIGAIAVLALLAGLIFWRHRRSSKARRAAAASTDSETETKHPSFDAQKPSTVFPKAELDDTSHSPFGLTHYDRDTKGLLLTPGASLRPDSSSAGTYGFPNSNNNSAYSPTTPSAGEGTHSSSHSAGTNALFSPLSAGGVTHASEADSESQQIYEMPGDMPTVREKDGKQLSEKEALRHRERLYNGIDGSVASTPTTSNGEQSEGATERRRLVRPEDVVEADRGEWLLGQRVVRGGNNGGEEDGIEGQAERSLGHRAFSFEAERAGAGTGGTVKESK